jgi:hypothetical protein
VGTLMRKLTCFAEGDSTESASGDGVSESNESEKSDDDEEVLEAEVVSFRSSAMRSSPLAFRRASLSAARPYAVRGVNALCVREGAHAAVSPPYYTQRASEGRCLGWRACPNTHPGTPPVGYHQLPQLHSSERRYKRNTTRKRRAGFRRWASRRWRAAERRYPTGRERMGSPTLQSLQDPILLLPWSCFRADDFPNPWSGSHRRTA